MKSIDYHKIIFEERKISNKGILLVHGITSSKDEGGFYIALAERLNQNNYSTFRFDFRGHGKSAIPSTQITISGMMADLFASMNYMEKNYDEYSIVAASFGASIFLLLLDILGSTNNLRTVIFLNPVTNYANTFLPENSEWAATFFPRGGISSLLTYNKEIRIGNKFILNPIMGIEFFQFEPNKVRWPQKIPLLIMHGSDDQIVSIDDSRSYKKNQSENVNLIEYEKAGHGLDGKREEVFQAILEQLSRFNHG